MMKVENLRRAASCAAVAVYILSAEGAAAQQSVSSASAPPAAKSPEMHEDKMSATSGEPASADIVVTARRRDERLEDVPVAVTALSGGALAQRRIDNAEALRFVAPALQVSPTPFGKAVPGYTIRSQRSLESLITQDPAVGIYFAEQVQERPHGTNSSLYDLGSVEVLKGPQGTLFGRNTTGGAILINPAKPTQDFEGSLGFTGGDYALKQGNGVLNVPLSDTLAVRFAGQVTRRDGYNENLTTGRRTDDERTESGRISFLWKPTGNFTNYIVGSYFHENDQGAGFVLYYLRPGSPAAAIPGVAAAFARQQARSLHKIENDQQPFARVKAWSISDTSTLTLGSVTLKNILGYRKVDSLTGFDFDGTPVVAFESQAHLRADQWTEELQISGNLSRRLNYIAGIYYFYEHGRDIQNSILFGTRANDGEGTNTSSSAYAQLGYKLTDRLNLTAGARYTIDKRELLSRNKLNGVCRLVDNTGSPLEPCFKSFDKSFRSPSWLVSLDYKVTPDTLLYVAHRRGYRSGGWNLRANTTAEQLPFNPENVYDVEVGLKTQMFDRHLQVNAALYNQWYKGIQRTLSFGTPLASVVLNAGDAIIRGGEVEINATPARWLELSGSLAYSDAHYTRFTAPGLGDLTDNQFAMAPKLTYTGTFRVNIPIADELGRPSISLSYYHQSKMYNSDLNQGVYFDRPMPAYGLFDLNAEWHGVAGYPIDLAVFVKNIANKEYVSGGASVYPTVGLEGLTVGDPQHFGIALTYRFGAMADRR